MTEYDKDFALRVAGLADSKGGRITPEMSAYHTTQQNIAYPVVYRFRSTVDADDYMRKHVKAIEIQGDTIFRDVQADIPNPVAIHDETCCMNGKFMNPHPECLGVSIVAGQKVLKSSIDPDVTEIPDDELPGMWEKADFMGGQDHVRGPNIEIEPK